jgi:hypothetical protein
MLSAFAAPAAAALPVFDLTTLAQAETDLGLLINRERTSQGLVAFQQDPDAMAIARRRAETMAAADVLSHQNPTAPTSSMHREAGSLVRGRRDHRLEQLPRRGRFGNPGRRVLDGFTVASGPRPVL